MQRNGLFGLLAVTLAAVIVAVFVSLHGGNPAADPLTGTPVLPEVAKRLDDVARIALVHGTEKITLLKKRYGWVVDEKGGYPADTDKVHQALLGLADLTYVEPKTRKAEYYPRLQLEDAGSKDSKSTLVTVADAKGSLLGEVITGKHRADQLGGGEDGIYVRKPGNAQTWLARAKLDLDGDATKWLDQKLLDLPAAKMAQIILTAPDGSKLTISRAKAGDPLTLAAIPAGKKLKSADALDDPAGALGNLELADVHAAKGFDFPKTGVTTAQFTDFSGLTVTVQLADKDGESWALLQASGAGDAQKTATVLNAKLSPWVFALPAYKVKALRSKMDDLVEAPKPS